MAPPFKYLFPSDDEIVALARTHRTQARIAQALGVPKHALGNHLARRPELRRALAEYALPGACSRDYPSAYPDDDTLVAMMAAERSFSAVARLVGVRRESLRDYLVRRPVLDARMREHLPVPLSPDERAERQRTAGREYAARMRREQPEVVRQKRRDWMRETPRGRRVSLTAREARRGVPLDTEAQEYVEILAGDPCVYCGAVTGRNTPDHIKPIVEGGTGAWHNLASACRSCNSAKGAKSLLAFLFDRLEGGVAHVQFSQS